MTNKQKDTLEEFLDLIFVGNPEQTTNKLNKALHEAFKILEYGSEMFPNKYQSERTFTTPSSNPSTKPNHGTDFGDIFKNKNHFWDVKSEVIPSTKTDVADVYRIKVNVAGYKKEDIKARYIKTGLKEVQLTIKDGEKEYVTSIYLCKHFPDQIKDISPDKMKASVKDGVLILDLEQKPKVSDEQEIKID